MSRSSFSNVTDQVVDLIREGMLSGRWRGTLPGRDQLAGELGVSNTTMEAAMRRLANEGLLVSQGTGKGLASGGGSFCLRVRAMSYCGTSWSTSFPMNP